MIILIYEKYKTDTKEERRKKKEEKKEEDAC